MRLLYIILFIVPLYACTNYVAVVKPDDLNGKKAVKVTVLDVGAGLCNLIELPGNKYVIYDAGGDFYTNGDRTFEQIKRYIPPNSTIELLVLSHTDTDHIVAAGQVIINYNVKKLLWTGYESSMISGNSTSSYKRLINALKQSPNTENVNLNERDSIITPGNKFIIGDVKFTFLCGFGKPLDEWKLKSSAEKINSVSIVMKMQFAGNSVLFCGDALGRRKDDPEDTVIATEKFLVDNAASFLKSTIVIAPHHGAPNASSQPFVNCTNPESVIFSAGHRNRHPVIRTANQYLKIVDSVNIFRTDRGDDEGGEEWSYLRVKGCNDKYDDDNIQILLESDSCYEVFYLEPEISCVN